MNKENKGFGKVVRDILTEDDGETWCLIRILFTFLFVCYLGFAAYEIHRTGEFHMVDFASGAMQIFGGGGVALGLKQFTTKNQTPTQ
jgi:hypothetical protein